ncbi:MULTISPECIES: GNAT family N-acetyltransferase [unclassified Kribbella]|uniref:GNAT family N-acetyltransferase n=1 Tax=unclassified Kribbella TaxID=2644121 RepID=UPI0033F133BA
MRTEVRRYADTDREAVLALAPRLAEGVAEWRAPDKVRQAVTRWVEDAVARAGAPGRFIYVAEARGQVAGFVAGEERTHWTGQADVYLGELVVDVAFERKGVGRALVEAVVEHAARAGVDRITLETGAANTQARRFYASLGFAEEDVRLTRVLS